MTPTGITNDFTSDVTLGKEYQDPQTGIQGTATSVHFYQYACERVCLEFLDKDGRLQTETFDAPRLVNVETGHRPETAKTGGPGDRAREVRPAPPR